jgi:V/A-type H+-transporting ATPase subunit I
MIVPMKKVFVAARVSDMDALLAEARKAGLVHLAPVEPAQAVADASTVEQIDRMGRAVQYLSTIEPAGDAPDVPPPAAAADALGIEQDSAEKRARLGAIARKIEHLEAWGDVRLEQFEQLSSAGVKVAFYEAEEEQVEHFRAELVHIVRELPHHRVLLAVASRGGEAPVPDDADPVPIPDADRPTLREEAQRINAQLDAYAMRLAELANLKDAIAHERRKLQSRAEYTVALRGGLSGEELYAFQGWVPADEVDELAGKLAAAGVEAVVEAVDPSADEQPPTLVRYPAWCRPIKALFDTLGTIPGFREFDVSGFFMVTMPIFVAMLIGDAGYGLLFTAVSLAMFGKIRSRAGGPAAWLVLIFSLTTVAWGVLTANFFGMTPENAARFAGFTVAAGGQTVGDVRAMLAGGGGAWGGVGRAMCHAAVLYRIDAEAARNVIIKVSFILGTIHLVSAHLRQAGGYWPDRRMLAELGWAMVLPGMLGVIWQMFFIGMDQPWSPVIGILIAAGMALVVLFSHPDRNPLKRIGVGIIGNVLPLISTFSDTMSYIRLMAVGLASYYIAYSFNVLGAQVAGASSWVLAVPVLIFGHGLNIGLGLIAIFAHGVRLNMLEFSTNAGIQWYGYAYRPFSETA